MRNWKLKAVAASFAAVVMVVSLGASAASARWERRPGTFDPDTPRRRSAIVGPASMRKPAVRSFWSAALVAAFIGSAPVVAMAYPNFVAATPAVGSLVNQSVQVVRIKISRPLFPGQTFARLADRSQPLERFPSGHVSKSHPRTIVVRLPHPLSPGRYVVHWQACAYACYVGSEPPISARYSFVVRPDRKGLAREQANWR